MSALTPGEHLVVLLGEGSTLAQAARQARMASQEAYAEAQSYGWPDRRQIRAAAAEIVQRQRTATSTTEPGEPMPRRNPPRRGACAAPIETDVADVLDPTRRRDRHHDGPAVSTRARDTAADAPAIEPDSGSGPVEEGAGVPLDPDEPQATDGADAPREPLADRATLRIPLGRYVDAAGVEIVLGEALVDVVADRDGILDWIAGTTEHDASPARVVGVRQELTADGRAAIEALAALLRDGDR